MHTHTHAQQSKGFSDAAGGAEEDNPHEAQKHGRQNHITTQLKVNAEAEINRRSATEKKRKNGKREKARRTCQTWQTEMRS